MRRRMGPRPREHALSRSLEADQPPQKRVVAAVGGVAVSRCEELIKAVLGEVVRRLDDGYFDGQPAEPRAAGEDQ
jgi:hypothetical protein